jgi:hypothetical protein
VRRTLPCPDCGEPLPVPAIEISGGYGSPSVELQCPNCLWFGVDAQLEVKKRDLLVWSGGTPSPFFITTLGGFERDNTTTAVSPFTVSVANNELFIAITGNVGGDAVPPTSMTLGTDTLTRITDSDFSEPCISVNYFLGTPTSAGQKSLTIVYPNQIDTVLCLMLKVSGGSASPIDGSSSLLESGSTVTWTSGNTAPLTAFNELAIGAFVNEHGFDINDRPTFGNGFNQQQFLQAENPSAIMLAQATRQLSDKSPVACKGTKAISASGSYSVVTIKPR